MMSATTIFANGRAYAFTPEERAPLGMHLWALVTGRVIDELSGEPPRTPLTITPLRRGIAVKHADDGNFALVARPFLCFAVLATPEHSVDFVLAAAGYLPAACQAGVRLYRRHLADPAAPGAMRLTLDDTTELRAGQALLLGPFADAEWTRIANVGPAAGEVTLAAATRRLHPDGAPVAADEFLPVALGDLALHRAPVELRGRTVRHDALSGRSVPVAAARVEVSGIWRSLDEVRRLLPPQPATLVALAPGLYAPRAAGTTLEALTLAPAAGDDKQLLADAAAGGAALRLSNCGALAVGALLLADPDQPDIAEYLAIAGITGGGSADAPCTAHLDFPLRCAHGAGARIQRVAPQPPAPPKAFAVEGMPGDRSVFLDDIGGLEAAGTVRIAGGGAPDEYQRIRTYAASSDADGYFRLPALTRAVRVRLHATSPGLAGVTVEAEPAYAEPDANWIDLRFPH